MTVAAFMLKRRVAEVRARVETGWLDCLAVHQSY